MAEQAAEPPACDHVYASKHQPGHRLYWIRQCMACHEVDWDALDSDFERETSDAAAAERDRIAALLQAQADQEREAQEAFPADPGFIGAARAAQNAVLIAKGEIGGEGLMP
jgi:hypothetical protein